MIMPDDKICESSFSKESLEKLKVCLQLFNEVEKVKALMEENYDKDRKCPKR